jgi:Domain of unknown function (DUF4249)
MQKITILCALALAFTSCQKVIDVDLNTASPQYVIEGLLNEGSDTFNVKISQTGSYFNAETPSNINAAQVTLTQDNGTPLALQSIGNGTYIAPNYIAQSDHNYTLKVVDNGKTFVAAAYMPRAVQPDSVVVSEFNNAPPTPPGGPRPVTDGKKDYLITTYFKDPSGVANYYRAIVFPIVKTRRNAGYDLTSDKNVDGASNSLTVYGRYAPNTTGSVAFISLDKKTYNYYNQLQDIISSSQNSVSPANPDNNWSNGALGYFGAAASIQKSILFK